MGPDDKKIDAFVDIGWTNAKALNMTFGEYRIALEKMLIAAAWRSHECDYVRTSKWFQEFGHNVSMSLLDGSIEMSVQKGTTLQ